jgi:hypothetical protein
VTDDAPPQQRCREPRWGFIASVLALATLSDPDASLSAEVL